MMEKYRARTFALVPTPTGRRSCFSVHSNACTSTLSLMRRNSAYAYSSPVYSASDSGSAMAATALSPRSALDSAVGFRPPKGRNGHPSGDGGYRTGGT